MRLFYANTSPYARKVRVVVVEKGLEARVDGVLCNPFDDVPELKAVNPLSKIPCLELDNGTALYDSPVIVEYLDSLVPAKPLTPNDGEARWQVLRQQALGDGILDAAFNTVIEGRRPEAQQSQSWNERWRAAIDRGLVAMDGEIDSLAQQANLAHITYACALGYLEFRLPDITWRTRHPRTATWFDAFAQRPSMISTQPET